MVAHINFIWYNTLQLKINGGIIKPRVCYICGKGKVSGNQVSHSHIATKRTWSANLQKKSIEVDGKVENKYICTRCLKTLKKED